MLTTYSTTVNAKAPAAGVRQKESKIKPTKNKIKGADVYVCVCGVRYHHYVRHVEKRVVPLRQIRENENGHLPLSI